MILFDYLNNEIYSDFYIYIIIMGIAAQIIYKLIKITNPNNLVPAFFPSYIFYFAIVLSFIHLRFVYPEFKYFSKLKEENRYDEVVIDYSELSYLNNTLNIRKISGEEINLIPPKYCTLPLIVIEKLENESKVRIGYSNKTVIFIEMIEES